LSEKLKKSEVKWQLTETEKDVKYQEWMEKSIKSIKKIKENYYSKIAIQS